MEFRRAHVILDVHRDQQGEKDVMSQYDAATDLTGDDIGFGRIFGASAAPSWQIVRYPSAAVPVALGPMLFDLEVENLPLPPLPPLEALAPPLPDQRAGVDAPAGIRTQHFGSFDEKSADVSSCPQDLTSDQPAAHRFMRLPNEPLGPDLCHLRTASEARRSELAAKRPPADLGQSPADPTISAASLAMGYQLLTIYRREMDVVQMPLEEIDPAEFVSWLLSRKATVKPGTHRGYKAAARAVVQRIPHPNIDRAIGLLEANVGVRSDQARSHPRRNRATTPDDNMQVAKPEHAPYMARVDFDEITSKVSRVRSKQAAAVHDWCVAGMHTGVVPLEWATASLEIWSHPNLPTRHFLHIVHPDAADASDPPYRTLEISNFSPPILATIQRMVVRSQNWLAAREFTYRQSQCAQLFYKICSGLFPRRELPFSLYTPRAQFVENMRAYYGGGPEVAALVGDHHQIERAHYKNSHLAWSPGEIVEVPIPSPKLLGEMTRRLALLHALERAKAARQDLKERNC
jgi:hypothetical protein